MPHRAKTLIKVLLLLSLTRDALLSPLTPETLAEETKPNKTISELVQEQAEAIKKIVSSQQPELVDYPTVTRKDPDLKLKETKEHESVEELRRKCQHFFKLIQKPSATTSAPTTTTFATVLPFGPPQKPEFLKFKHYQTQHQQESAEDASFIGESTQTNSVALLKPNPSNEQQQQQQEQEQDPENYYYPSSDKDVKYIKLEPVILQRLLMSNGQNYYYWYRTVPNHVKYAEPYQSASSNVPTVYKPPNHYNHNNNVVMPETGGANSKLHVKYAVPLTTTSSTTATPVPVTTTTTTPVQTGPFPGLPDHNGNGGFRHELKFVVPYSFKQPVYPNYPEQFDPYAYYPKYLQPASMSVQVPYQPAFHMIKTLSVPNNGEEGKSPV